MSLTRSLNTIGEHLCVVSQRFCPPRLLQIVPSFQRQLTDSSLTKYDGEVGDIDSHLIRKLIDVLFRLGDFLGG